MRLNAAGDSDFTNVSSLLKERCPINGSERQLLCRAAVSALLPDAVAHRANGECVPPVQIGRWESE